MIISDKEGAECIISLIEMSKALAAPSQSSICILCVEHTGYHDEYCMVTNIVII